LKTVEYQTKTNAPPKIQEYSLIKVALSKLKFDPENPNEMSEEEEKSLRNSFETFGNVQYIVIDQNSLIVHGNHRAKVLSEMGAKEVTVIKRHFKDDDERRIFSQTMNKLHGSYDKLKDAAQLEKLFANNRLKELGNLIAHKETDLIEFIEMFSKKNVNNIDELNLKDKTLNLIEDPELLLKFNMKNKDDYTEVITKLRYIDDKNKENALLTLVRSHK